MAKPFRGKIALDIRDSTPDWDPYLPPRARDGAPNVLVLAWDDVGYGTMEVFGGPVQTPNMQRIADRGVKFANFHTTALCSPTRVVADRSQRDEHIVTQPGNFCLIGDGICVGRDSASPVTPDYADRGTFPLTGGTIEKVVIDVSGNRYVDDEAQVRAWLLTD